MYPGIALPVVSLKIVAGLMFASVSCKKNAVVRIAEASPIHQAARAVGVLSKQRRLLRGIVDRAIEGPGLSGESSSIQPKQSGQ